MIGAVRKESQTQQLEPERNAEVMPKGKISPTVVGFGIFILSQILIPDPALRVGLSIVPLVVLIGWASIKKRKKPL